jgi:hypothetical protein
MQAHLLYMPWTFRSHRPTSSCFPSPLHVEHVQSTPRSLSLLPSIQTEQVNGVLRLIWLLGLVLRPILLDQIYKYIAKFSLLERGLLDAAHGVDDLRIRVHPQQPKSKPKVKGVGEVENGGSDDEMEASPGTNPPIDIPDETNSEFEARINLYVNIHLNRASSSKRDGYKDGLVYQTRKDLITDFLKSTILKKCQNEGCCA